ncbi:tRNA dimethylallyltransferase [Candidatus Beckwithbacteria bacterium]|nr:tRNA dimethylallyltransferase [Candidatus Beckwithbacteria bacterium]
MNKMLIITGPTATGKTKLALKLAKAFDGELISADSRQVYQGMDIVTGKDICNNAKFKIKNLKNRFPMSICFWRNRLENDNLVIGFYEVEKVKIWGLDLVKPDQEFHVSAFVKITQNLIKDILDRNKLPIIIGGTAFYLKSLLNPPKTLNIAINKELRQELDKLSLQELQERLQDLNIQKWEQMNFSDRNNPRRLVRAIEVFLSGEDLAKNIQNSIFNDQGNIQNLIIGLKAEQEFLAKHIKQRVLKRLKQGAIAETQKLLQKYKAELPSMSALGYKEIRQFLDYKIKRQELIEFWTLHESQYAKRQMTFMKKFEDITWFDILQKDFDSQIKLLVQKFLKND